MRLAENVNLTVAPRSYHNTLNRFIAEADRAEISGQVTMEAINSTLLLKNPLDRLVMDPARKLNPGFAAAEWYSFMTGENHIDFFQRFIHDYDRFSTNGETLDGCYGERVNFGMSQVDGVIADLQRDPTSRRAVISIYLGSSDLFGGGGKNTPCTETIQFLIRGEKLQCVVNMRSFDLVKGLSYDMYVFTMLQEYVARALGIPVGWYWHNAASMHVYAYDLPMIEKMGREPRWPFVMQPMPQIQREDLDVWKDQVDGMFEAPDEFMSIVHRPAFSTSQVHDYLVTQSALMFSFAMRKDEPVLALKAHDLVRSPSLKRLLRPWLVSAGIRDSAHRLG